MSYKFPFGTSLTRSSGISGGSKCRILNVEFWIEKDVRATDPISSRYSILSPSWYPSRGIRRRTETHQIWPGCAPKIVVFQSQKTFDQSRELLYQSRVLVWPIGQSPLTKVSKNGHFAGNGGKSGKFGFGSKIHLNFSYILLVCQVILSK